MDIIIDGLAIKPVNKDQLKQLHEVVKETFLQSFGHRNKPPDIQIYTDQKLSFGAIQAEFNTYGSEFYFAKIKDELIGYLKLNCKDAQTELKEEEGLEIERIYLHSNYQNQGLGKTLLKFSIERAIELKKEYIWLGVWSENKDAIRFYQRHGFTIFDQHDFMLGNDEQTDYLMRKELI